MNQKDRVLNALNLKSVDRVPVGSFTTTPVLELMEACGAFRPEADHDPEKMALLALSAHENCGFETARFPFDMTVLAEAVGCTIDPGTTSRTPAVIEGLKFDDPDDLNFIPDDLCKEGRIPQVLEAAYIVRKSLGDDGLTVAGHEGPVDLAANIVGMKEFLLLTLKNRPFVERLLDICADACIEYGNACIAAGADAVCVADAISSPGILPPNDFEELALPRYIRISSSLKGPGVLHVCGRVDLITDSITECGFDGISVEESVQDLRNLITTAHEKDVAVIGNVSASSTLYSGSEEDVNAETLEALDCDIDIIAPGCGIAPETPINNLKAMVKARDSYY
ncbi:methyltransferase MtaA/CmuA family [Methanosalsum zhilinae DSM 4017]|uniref:Methyltransferase MtaA/CmuA family n=1 Tax=Methanosalsum zhilinae (strain DSM 4017 / NBRC 107636 / OCM 62 / WeN5) TaxID=679901 RepID=F7XQN4_METZD|nr:methylcobamide:CoM methyltransferase MtaA [Methanosalsum zhilinae]AEH61633.1 methyltransferase MtaA/CmuA family [Methanosalsum zhilinae DSM 4017]